MPLADRKSPIDPSVSQSGASLLGVLIALSVMGITAMASASAISQSFQTSRNFEIRGEIEDLRGMLRRTIGCKESFPTGTPAVCKTGGFIAINTRTNSAGDSTVLIGKSNGTSFTRYKSTSYVLRAWCGPQNKLDPAAASNKTRFAIQVNRIKNDVVLKDPLTNKYMSGALSLSTKDQGWNLDVFEGIDICKL